MLRTVAVLVALLALTHITPFSVQAADDVVVARQGDWKLTLAEVDAGLQGPLFKLKEKMFKLRFERIQELISERLIKEEARSKGIKPEAMMEKMLMASMPNIGDREVDAFIKARKDRMPEVTPKMREQIRDYITAMALEESQARFLVSLAKKYDVTTFIKPPKRPRLKIKDSPLAKGPKKAPITIVEFSDFQCPYCRRAQGMLKELEKRYPGKLRFVFKHFPLPNHKLAPKASEASLCAGDQGKFWAYHDALFVDGADMSDKGLTKIAKSLKLNMATYNKCLSSEKHGRTVFDDIEEGRALGVSGTPTFFVNGMMMVGAVSLDELIQLELASQKK
ncbi:MAG: thioredoxin domain-containing protein [Magnetococcales bacterium]|nr:thioredoxin domain-containing protein [Magnetococcales bacterium]